MNIIFLPIFKDPVQFTDHYYRMCWYLYPLQKNISKISFLYNCDEVNPHPPEHLSDELLDISKKITGVEFVRATNIADCKKIIQESDIVLLWQIDNQQIEKIPPRLKKLTEGKRIVRIDHQNERHASSFYLKLAEHFPYEIDIWKGQSQDIFSKIIKKCKSEKGYIFGTGPNLESVNDHNFSDGVAIACNSMVRNKKLMDRLTPPIIVMADPIFHAGPSSYAAEFRKYLVKALDDYNSYLVVPQRDYHIYRAYLPERFHNRISGIPYKSQNNPNLDLSKEFYVTSTANIMTLFLIPLASTLFKEVGMAGFDGRPMNENEYFWKHDEASQFTNHLDKIKEAHPAFFDINYDDYYNEHCKILERWLQQADCGKNKYNNLTQSYIPSLIERYKKPFFSDSKISEIVMLDPDGIDDSGHFISYDDRMQHACLKNDLTFTVFGSIKVSLETLKKRSFLKPIFSDHSWSLGNRIEGSNLKELQSFTSELTNELSVRFDSGLTHNTMLYMYCGSLPAAKAILEATKNYNNVSATVCLFWLSFVDYSDVKYIRLWKDFVHECILSKRITLTLATSLMVKNFSKAFEIELPVNPHPSTTFFDYEVLNFINIKKSKNITVNKETFNIIFPGGVREDKGFHLTAKLVPKISTNLPVQLKSIVRISKSSNIPTTMQHHVNILQKSDCTIVSEPMNDKEYINFLISGDIAVLPYQPPRFSDRTSGLLIDFLYLSKPIIVWEGTWLSEIVKQYEIGVVVCNQSHQDFNKAINKLVNNYDFYVTNLIKAKKLYFENNSWDSLINFLLNKNIDKYRQTGALSTDMKFSECKDEVGAKFFDRSAHANIDETKVIARLLSDTPQGSIMLDIGAHHGSALAPFSKMNWTIFAFEPNSINRKTLIDRFESLKNIVIDSRAVAEKESKNKPFYISDESTGISGLLSFRETHKVFDEVDVTTVSNIVDENNIKHIDFLKIDVEGYDFSVLKGVPWEKIKPDVIECEFEDAKTKLLGHSWRDICEYLVDKGYIIYVSEWHPIVRYGIRHDWLGIKKYPCELEDENAWGNLLAFSVDPGESEINDAVQAVIDVKNPNHTISVEDKKTALANNQVQAVSSKKNKPKQFKRGIYVRFAIWARDNNQTIFRLGQLSVWYLRYMKRHPMLSMFLIVICTTLILLPNITPEFFPYRLYLYSASSVIIALFLITTGTAFLNRRLLEFVAREDRLRSGIKRQIDSLNKSLNEKLSQVQATIDEQVQTQTQQSVAMGERLEAQSQQQDELDAAISELRSEDEKLSQVQATQDNFISSSPLKNFSGYQSFNRQLSDTHIEIFQKKWGRILGIDLKPRLLSYLAHRIFTIEGYSRGRLATTTEDVLLRTLVTGSVRGDSLRVLEIGTLFGIGLSVIYDYTKPRYESVHLTAIDPLNGYYGKDVNDIVTGEPISEATVNSNLAKVGAQQGDYTLIKNMSTDDVAIDSIRGELHDVLIIDGDHSYSGVKADFINYMSIIKRGGYIIFDDYGVSDWPDVKRFVDEVVMVNPNLALVGIEWRTAVFKVVKRPKPDTKKRSKKMVNLIKREE